MYFSEKSNETGTLFDLNIPKKKLSISHLAFRTAQKKKKKLTLVDKANILETPRLWRVVTELFSCYPDVVLNFCSRCRDANYQSKAI
jgi:3-isopropylmalate dehydrogenase